MDSKKIKGQIMINIRKLYIYTGLLILFVSLNTRANYGGFFAWNVSSHSINQSITKNNKTTDTPHKGFIILKIGKKLFNKVKVFLKKQNSALHSRFNKLKPARDLGDHNCAEKTPEEPYDLNDNHHIPPAPSYIPPPPFLDRPSSKPSQNQSATQTVKGFSANDLKNVQLNQVTPSDLNKAEEPTDETIKTISEAINARRDQLNEDEDDDDDWEEQDWDN
jgi:hypothetical protein